MDERRQHAPLLAIAEEDEQGAREAEGAAAAEGEDGAASGVGVYGFTINTELCYTERYDYGLSLNSTVHMRYT